MSKKGKNKKKFSGFKSFGNMTKKIMGVPDAKKVDAEDSKESDKSKSKKSKFDFRHANDSLNQFPLVKALKLPEIVPTMALTELQKYAQTNSGAVRKVSSNSMNDYYSVIILSEDMIESVGISKKDEDFGQFGASLKSSGNNGIKSAALPNDIANGRIVIIPDEYTVANMDSFHWLHQLNFHWGLFPDNVDSDYVEVLDTDKVVSLDSLVQISQNNVTDIDFGDSFDLGDNPSSQESDDANDDNNSDDNQANLLESLNDLENNVSDDQGDKDQNNNNTNDIDETVEQDNDDHLVQSVEQQISDSTSRKIDTADYDATDEEKDADFAKIFEDNNDDVNFVNDDSDNAENDQPDEPQMSPDEFLNKINTLDTQKFYNDGLDLKVMPEMFNQTFVAQSPLQFDYATPLRKNDLLNSTLNAMRKDMNSELSQMRSTNIENLKRMYLDRMTNAVIKITQNLDSTNPDVDSGKKRKEIEHRHEQALSTLKRNVKDVNKKYDEKFKADQLKYAEAAKQAALSEFTAQHKDEYESLKGREIKTKQNGANAKYANNIHQYNQKRKLIASKALDTFNKNLMNDMQDLFDQMVSTENDVKKDMADRLNNYKETHFDQEVQRADIIAKDLERNDLVADTKRDYQKRIDKLNQDIVDNKIANDKKYQNMLDSLTSEKVSLTKELNQQIKELNDENTDLRKKIDTVDSRKAKEYKEQMDNLNNTISTQRLSIEANDAKAKNQMRTNIVSWSAVTVLALFIGGMTGYAVNQHESNVDKAKTEQVSHKKTTKKSKSTKSNAKSNSKNTNKKSKANVTKNITSYTAVALDKNNSVSSVLVDKVDSYKQGKVVDASVNGQSFKMTVVTVHGRTVTVDSPNGNRYVFNSKDSNGNVDSKTNDVNIDN